MAKSEEKQKQIADLLQKAEQGIKDIFESDRYKEYLSTMSKFHNYSFRNTLLILMQKPEASYVAGYVAWKEKFNRQVQKGEKGIQIIGYTPKKIQEEVPKKDKVTGNDILDTNGKPQLDIITRQIPYFTPVYVYDVSQTDGEPLPKLVNELDGSVETYNSLMDALKEVSPYPIEFEAIKGGTRGYCDPVKQKIAIKEGMSEAQTIKTAIHEITHADLHAPELNLSLAEKTDRNTKEVEAESTAFVVCSHYGIDTSDYSFGYLASWSSDKELKELQNSLETIQKQAGELIDRIDTRLAELQTEQLISIDNINSDKWTDRISVHYEDIRNDKNEIVDSGYLAHDKVTGYDVLDDTKEGAVQRLLERIRGNLIRSEVTIPEQNNILTFKEFLNSHRGATINAMTQGGFLSLSAEQTQNYENLSSVSSHLGDSESDYKRALGDELFNATVYIHKYNEATNEYTLMLDELEGAKIKELSQEQTTDRTFTPTEPTSRLDVLDAPSQIDITSDKKHFNEMTEYIIIAPVEELMQVAEISREEAIKMKESAIQNNFEQTSLEQRRADEMLDTVRFDNDIDLDREKTREQLGFRDNDKEKPDIPEKKDEIPLSMKDRMQVAKAEAKRRNGNSKDDKNTVDKNTVNQKEVMEY